MQQLVIATQNPGKVAELRVLLGGLAIEVLGLGDLGREFEEPAEHGRTFEQNAALKAVAYAEMTGLPCLADDSGLEVDALGGRPGVDSAWYAYPSEAEAKAHPRQVRDPKNLELLLSQLGDVPEDQRTGRFVCCMAVAEPKPPPSSGTGFQQVEPNPSQTHSQSILGQNMSSIQTHPRGPLRISHGNLPHWHRDGGTYFITFRLQRGALSEEERDIVFNSCLHWHGQRMLVHLAVVMPDYVHLLISPLKEEASDDWHQVPAIMHSIKSFSANAINRARGTTGVLWMPEHFDRLLRDSDEIAQKREYMLSNPVKAGLVKHWTSYRWTRSGGEDDRLDAGPTDSRVLAVARGTFEGRIGIPPRVPAGDHGFGYDPIFLVAPDYTHTSAELGPEEKNAISHRARAAAAMLEKLAQLDRE